MATTREIRRRIRSISSTAQITRAMQMVAASKMRKAQQAATSVRPFIRLLYQMQRVAVANAVDFKHPLLANRPIRKRAIVLIAPDRGLCGALSSNLFRLAAKYDPASTLFLAAGRKAGQFVTRSHRQLAAEFPYGDSPRFPEARAIAHLARDLFLKGEVDEIRIVATRFLNTLTQEAVDLEYLPIGEITSLQVPDEPAHDLHAAGAAAFLFEPGAAEVLAYLFNHYLSIFLYVVMLNAKASEQSARMVSMKTATDSAEAMIEELTLAYNKLRQGQITQELLEIAGGQSN
jgi:F-type H+-transporting ATPase subunit gamma